MEEKSSGLKLSTEYIDFRLEDGILFATYKERTITKEIAKKSSKIQVGIY